MALEYDHAWCCHCSLTLLDGRGITLKALRQRMTYAGLLEGTPCARLNDRIVESAVEAARRDWEPRDFSPALIPPARRPFLREPQEESDPGREQEWLPMITCTAEFESHSPARNPEMDGSALTVVWFQDDYALPLSAAALEAIKAIDWQARAHDFQW